MLKIQSDIDYLLATFKGKKVKINYVSAVPVDEIGLEMGCYTPFNVNFPISYEANLKRCGGDASKVKCWSSPEYYEFSHIAQRRKHSLNYARDCSTCNFSLDQAVSFSLRISISNTELSDKKVISALSSLIKKIGEKLPKPISNIRISSEGDFGLYNRMIQISYEEAIGDATAKKQ